jgi:hypothetical protein
MFDFINAQGIRVIDEDRCEVKARPCRGAFGDWNQYDAAGNVTTLVVGSSEIVSEHDELANNWGYATQTEQRKLERGDEPVADATSTVWFSKRGDKVVFGNDRFGKNEERSYKEHDGVVTCWYCAESFSAKWFIMQSDGGTLTRAGMEAFAISCALHNVECKAEHGGYPMLRFTTWSGERILRSAKRFA